METTEEDSQEQRLLPENPVDSAGHIRLRGRAPPAEPETAYEITDSRSQAELDHEKSVRKATCLVWGLSFLALSVLMFLEIIFFTKLQNSALVLGAFAAGFLVIAPFFFPIKKIRAVADDYGDMFPNRPSRHPQTYYKLVYGSALLVGFSGGLMAGAYFGQWNQDTGPEVKGVHADFDPTLFPSAPVIVHFADNVHTSKTLRAQSWFSSFQFRNVNQISVCVAALVKEDEDYFDKPVFYIALVEAMETCHFPTCGRAGEGDLNDCVGFSVREPVFAQKLAIRLANEKNFTLDPKSTMFLALVPKGVDPHIQIRELWLNGWVAVLVSVLVWPFVVLLALFIVLKIVMRHNSLSWAWGLI